MTFLLFLFMLVNFEYLQGRNHARGRGDLWSARVGSSPGPACDEDCGQPGFSAGMMSLSRRSPT